MSTKRSIIFATGEFYHIFNRTIAGEEIFTKKKDIKRALELLSFYRFNQTVRFSFFNRLKKEEQEVYLEKISKTEPIIEIYAYAFMPNHFHFLLAQKQEDGIKKFLSNFQNSFAKFFNIKDERNGALFQRPFKAKHISTDKEFLHISRYIHLNPVTSYLITYEDLKESSLTSYRDYLKGEKSLVNTKLITKLSGSPAKYERFVANQITYQKELSKIKHLTIEK